MPSPFFRKKPVVFSISAVEFIVFGQVESIILFEIIFRWNIVWTIVIYFLMFRISQKRSTPIPGFSVRVILPSFSFIPEKQSLARSIFPLRSAHSISGESCAAAEIATEVSVIQPIISLKPRDFARVTISLASLIPVHFISLMFIPLKAPLSFGMSARRWQDSSAIIGRGLLSVSHA